MSEWKEYRLGDLCYKVCSGGTPKSTCSSYYEGGTIPWLNTKEINYNRIFETESHITEDGLNNSSAKWIDSNAVVVAMYGATAGRVAIAKVPMTTNQACCNLMIDSSKADYNFIYYYLSNSYKYLLSMANGAAQQNLNAQIIKDLFISLPSLDEQRSIASILSSLDSKIENNRKICANLEAQAQALFKHWFIDFAPFKDGKFVESELGMIPEGWRVGKVQDLASKMASGGTPTSTNRDYYGGDVLWFSTKELTDSFLLDSEKYITQRGLENSSAKLFPEDTVLMAIYAAPTVGRLGILTQEASFNQAAVGIVAKEEIGYEYIYLLLLSERKNLNNLACGAAQQNLNVGIVKNYKCVIPTKQVLSTFRKMITEIFLQCKELQKESSRLGELRDTLLPKLMSGEIKV